MPALNQAATNDMLIFTSKRIHSDHSVSSATERDAPLITEPKGSVLVNKSIEDLVCTNAKNCHLFKPFFETLMLAKVECINARKEIRELEASKRKIKEAKLKSLKVLPAPQVKLEVSYSNLLDKDDPEMKRIVEEYLENVNKMGGQLQQERLRQMKNCQHQFDKKLSILSEKQDEFKQKYSKLFMDYLEKHSATVRVLEQSETSTENETDYSEIERLFAGGEEAKTQDESDLDNDPLDLGEIQLHEKSNPEDISPQVQLCDEGGSNSGENSENCP
ncbi:unnamed protein product [Moneuplotes crassus]|uniref:Uncharacterized protein n=1 Tax=Euplotes crassus TaxID=5936 RepID=A0AAD2CYC0_EUPCR|nr:unnamed protein product [Moneuplotes crassus]